MITLQELTTLFHKFNEEIFSSELPLCELYISASRTQAGYFRVIRKFGRKPRVTIAVSRTLPMIQEEIEDTLVHEMIHYLLYHRGIKESRPHGNAFRTIMKDINLRYGRHITISLKIPDQRQRELSGTTPNPNIICVIRWKEGTLSLTKCSRPLVGTLLKFIRHSREITESQWYYSSAPILDKYPLSRTPKFYRLTEQDYIRLRENAVRLTPPD